MVWSCLSAGQDSKIVGRPVGGVVVLEGGRGGSHQAAGYSGRSCATVGSALECRRCCIDGGVMWCGVRQRYALAKLGLP